MKKQIALLLVLCMIFSLGACKKPAETPDNTGTNQTTGSTGNSTGTNAVSSVNTATGYTGVILPAGNDDLINPEKFGGKKLQIYGYSSDVYEDLENMDGSYTWMVRAAVDEWAYLNNVEVDFYGDYDQFRILCDIGAGGKLDLVLECNTFPTPALTGIIRPFTQEEYSELVRTCGTVNPDLMKLIDKSYGVQLPWAGGKLFHYNKTQFEMNIIKSPGEYFEESNWNWDTFETCMTQICSVPGLNGTGNLTELTPEIYIRELDEKTFLHSLVRDSEVFDRFLDIYNNLKDVCPEREDDCDCVTTPRPATAFRNTLWYDFADMHRVLENGDIIEAIPVPPCTNDAECFYNHNTAYAGILAACDEPEAAFSLLNYILRVGMRYMSDYSLGLYKCNYEGIRGVSDYSLGWKQNFAEIVAKRQADFNKLTDWDQELYLKTTTYINEAERQFVTCEFPGEGGTMLKDPIYKNPISSVSDFIKTEEAWIKLYNELYAEYFYWHNS